MDKFLKGVIAVMVLCLFVFSLSAALHQPPQRPNHRASSGHNHTLQHQAFELNHADAVASLFFAREPTFSDPT